jgi:hypothetical protein
VFFNHIGEEWFLPGNDEVFKTMGELEVSNSDKIQLCWWMIECMQLWESYKKCGLAYFDNGQPTSNGAGYKTLTKKTGIRKNLNKNTQKGRES